MATYSLACPPLFSLSEIGEHVVIYRRREDDWDIFLTEFGERSVLTRALHEHQPILGRTYVLAVRAVAGLLLYDLKSFLEPAKPKPATCPSCDGKGRYTDITKPGWPVVRCEECS